jgi:Domain of unknown function (DUF4407)
MSVRMWLARLAGARPGLLEKAPGDLAKHATMGGVLVSTALVSAISAFFALATVLELPAAPSAAIGLCWGVIILNLDRMLVVSMGRQNGFWLNVWMLVPRLLLAAVIGTVISTPMVLRVFQPEIESELTTMHAEAAIESRKIREDAFVQIERLEKREKELQAIVAGGSTAAVSADPDVKAAQAAYDAAEKSYQKAQSDAQCELDGTCGTGDRGVGESYRQKERAAADARAARDTAKRKLDDVTAEVSRRLQDGARSQADAAAKELPVVQTDLARYRAERDEAEKNANEAESGNTGLLARLEALGRITENSPGGSSAHWMLFLLFLSIEVLPVLSKFLASLGAPSAYDRLLAREDQQIDHSHEVWSHKQRSVIDAQADIPVQIELHKAAAQLAAGKAAVDALVAKQTKIALRAVDVWGDLAAHRSDEELHQWYREHIGATVAPPSRTPGSQRGNAVQTIPMRPVPPPPAGFGPAGTLPAHP